MIKNNKGQMMIESAAVLLILVPLISFVFLSCYVVIARKWADYWVYRTALCQTLAPAHTCKRQLYEKLSYVLPNNFYHWESGWTTRQHSQVTVRLQLFDGFQMRIRSRIARAQTTEAL